MPQEKPSDPFAALVAEALAEARRAKPTRMRAKSTKGTKKPKGKPYSQRPTMRGFANPTEGNEKPTWATSPWTTEALVLLIHKRTCTQCGTSYEAPEGLFIQRSRLLPGARLDSHLERITLDQARGVYPHLPRRRLVRPLRVPACELCFDTEETLAHIARAQAPFGWQPELPLGASASAAKAPELLPAPSSTQET